MNKWTRVTWLDASLAETYEDAEDVTLPAASALVSASGIVDGFPLSSTAPIRVLDNGAGMGQVTECLVSRLGDRQAEIVCGDVDEGLLDVLREKRSMSGTGWTDVEVSKLDATVRSSLVTSCILPSHRSRCNKGGTLTRNRT